MRIQVLAIKRAVTGSLLAIFLLPGNTKTAFAQPPSTTPGQVGLTIAPQKGSQVQRTYAQTEITQSPVQAQPGKADNKIRQSQSTRHARPARKPEMVMAQTQAPQPTPHQNEGEVYYYYSDDGYAHPISAQQITNASYYYDPSSGYLIPYQTTESPQPTTAHPPSPVPPAATTGQELPDLVVTDIKLLGSASDQGLHWGRDFAITVKNKGKAPSAPTSFVLQVKKTGGSPWQMGQHFSCMDFSDSFKIPALGQGRTTTIRGSFFLPGTWHLKTGTVFAVVDSSDSGGGQVAEANERNNSSKGVDLDNPYFERQVSLAP